MVQSLRSHPPAIPRRRMVLLAAAALLPTIEQQRWAHTLRWRPGVKQVDDIGDITVTNDGATILKQLEVAHPAARVLVDTSDLQDKEVGDGTTSVVILAAELLQVRCFARALRRPSGCAAAAHDLAPRVRSLTSPTLCPTSCSSAPTSWSATRSTPPTSWRGTGWP